MTVNRQPGWYPDPLAPSGYVRYHDGSRWWPDTRVVRTSNPFFIVLAVISVIGTLLFAVPLIAVGSIMGYLWLFWGGCWTLFWFGLARR